MRRVWVLIFVLMFIVLTSQLEWNEQVESEIETSPKQQRIPHAKDSAQEKKILSHEINIQKLNELVHDLRRQLLKCRNENQVSLTELVTEVDQLPARDV